MTGSSAARMDEIYRWQRGIYDLTRKYYLLGRDDLIARLDPQPGGSVLEIGCGTGRNLIQAARRHPAARLHGFDISALMLETARAKIASAGLGDRIAVAQGDAASFDAEALFGRARFERVFISYALSMIPPWRDALVAAADVVAPGGRLAIVDFGDQAGLPVWFKGSLRAWLKKFDVEPRDDLPGQLSALAAERGWRLEMSAPYRGYVATATLYAPA